MVGFRRADFGETLAATQTPCRRGIRWIGDERSDRRNHERWNETPADLTRQTEARIAEGGSKGKAEGAMAGARRGQTSQRSQKT